MILGLDIGGANTKAASADGRFLQLVYLPLWKGADLEGAVRSISKKSSPKAVAVVITGELADCYKSKLEGISSIMAAVNASFSCPVRYWGVNGFSWKDPLELAGANWSASATLVSRDIGDCIFVDMGSTTTDLIPIKGLPLAAHTDFLRLCKGELIYTGILRTAIGCQLAFLETDGMRVQICPELFSIMADAYLALGMIGENEYTCQTPDGAGKSMEESLVRLARMVCSQVDEIGKELALEIASQAVNAQKEMIASGLARMSRNQGISRVVAAGIGEDIICQVAANLNFEYIRISERYSKRISNIFPAYAAARLLQEAIEQL